MSGVLCNVRRSTSAATEWLPVKWEPACAWRAQDSLKNGSPSINLLSEDLQEARESGRLRCFDSPDDVAVAGMPLEWGMLGLGARTRQYQIRVEIGLGVCWMMAGQVSQFSRFVGPLRGHSKGHSCRFVLLAGAVVRVETMNLTLLQRFNAKV